MTATDKEMLIKIIDSHDSDEAFVRQEILHRTPHVFDGDDQSYLDFRAEIAGILVVPSSAVFVTGSGATGLSLAPHKFGRAFDPGHSDLDVAVSDNTLFCQMWDALLASDRSGNRVRGHVRSNIYWGKADHKHLSRSIQPGKRLFAANREARRFLDDRLECSIRVFRDANQLIAYQVHSIQKAMQDFKS